jgi:flagellum-specific ATP synthase
MSAAQGVLAKNIGERLTGQLQHIDTKSDLLVSGKLIRVVGLTIEAVGFKAAIGTKCLIETADKKLYAEVVGFSEETLFLMTTDDTQGLLPGTKVTPVGMFSDIAVSENMLGRMMDGELKPLDNKGPINNCVYYPLKGYPINPLKRKSITEVLDVGVSSINSLFTIGRGQRMGLFAGSGVGKSVLLGMMTQFTEADVIVVGLIGERSREIKDFIEHNLGPEGMKKAVVVAASASSSALMKIHATMSATSIATYFRDKGKNVLLLIDSLTRFAHAQREIGLSIGEPPTTKGYPPSVFSKLLDVVEASGNPEEGDGSLTAIYTVLVEGDDHNDPIADAARSILDGHIFLSRKLAEQGVYPAVDVESSISRVMTQIVPREQEDAAKLFRNLYTTYNTNIDLINIGAYRAGSNPDLDLAVKLRPKMLDFMQQNFRDPISYLESCNQLTQMLAPAGKT